MRKDLEKKFYDRWPAWFSGRHEGERHNLMCHGFEHGDGWFDLEWRLCEDLEKILGDLSPHYKLMQVKEKCGVLRWYDCGMLPFAGDSVVYKAVCERVDQAEQESGKVCELCGKPGIWRWDSSPVQTLCMECAEVRC